MLEDPYIDLIFDQEGLPVLVYLGPGQEFLVGGRNRSPEWSKVRDAFIKANQTCACCGRKADVVHHKEPYHLFPEKELDPDNLMSACDGCHLVVLHAGDYRLWVNTPDREARRHRIVVRLAKLRSVKNDRNDDPQKRDMPDLLPAEPA